MMERICSADGVVFYRSSLLAATEQHTLFHSNRRAAPFASSTWAIPPAKASRIARHHPPELPPPAHRRQLRWAGPGESLAGSWNPCHRGGASGPLRLRPPGRRHRDIRCSMCGQHPHRRLCPRAPGKPGRPTCRGCSRRPSRRRGRGRHPHGPAFVRQSAYVSGDIFAAVGPRIGFDVFEVGPEVVEQFMQIVDHAPIRLTAAKGLVDAFRDRDATARRRSPVRAQIDISDRCAISR